MDSITKKYKERVKVENISFDNPDSSSNFNHLAIDNTECSFKDNLQLFSRNEVEGNTVPEVLPRFSCYDPDIDLFC